MKLRELLARRTLWVGFFTAFVPLLILLVLQYVWLIRLEETTALAGRAVLANVLDGVTTEVLYTYGPSAERALDIPPSMLTENRPDKLAAHFRKRSEPGVRAYFAVRFAHDLGDTLLVFDPESEQMLVPPPGDQTRAITVACAPWKLMNDNGIEADDVRLVVEERDPDNRLVLNPILDSGSRVVGVAGMVFDNDYFRTAVLPAAVRGALGRLLDGQSPESYMVTVRDGRGRLVYTSSPGAGSGVDDLARPFTFVFTDWRIGIRSRGPNPEQWARAGFAVNLTIALLAGLLLTGGLALVLRTASREMRLSRMKSDFVANVSHELRTPLASIRMFGELLKLGRATGADKVREYGEYIERESRRLTQLVDNILDFARIEAGQKEYHFTVGQPTELIAEIVRTFQTRLTPSGITIAFDPPDSPLPPVRMDPDALGQALHNLLDNAVKYSGDSRWVGVRAAAKGESVTIAVEDRGLGISESEQRHIFDRFHRVGTGLVHDVRGSGLGLSIVHHVIRAHGGSVTVSSEPGRGSLFTIHLPIAGASAASPQASRSESLRTESPRSDNDPNPGVAPGPMAPGSARTRP